VVDGLLEASVVGSFSSLGIAARRRIGPWPDPPRLDGRTVIVTGASSGIGRAAALALAALGADLWLVGRNESRLAGTRAAALLAGAAGRIETAAVDLVQPRAVLDFAARVHAADGALHGLVHNAGALFPQYATGPDGVELTVATHVLAPFRLTWLLAPLLRHTRGSVIVTVASGGMYTQRFDLGRLEMHAQGYNGVTAYARAKRAQVVLTREWVRRWSGDGVASYAMHPGWVDTPGLTTGLPAFARLGPLLRTPAEGADTAVWLAAGGPRSAAHDGRPSAHRFWHDRRPRGQFYLPTTRRTRVQQDADGRALWDWCIDRIGWGDNEARTEWTQNTAEAPSGPGEGR
jgi:NAD(P)-dependent dehydrogenase (short-subunit alcohol dehydrogenase family)